MRHRGNSVHEIGALNTGFLLEKEGATCGPMQQLRELTQNGVEAVLARGGTGTVVWSSHRPEGSRGPRKLSVTDDGTGLTGPEMTHYFGNLAASGRDQARDANFGMGAKIALHYYNPHGVVWRSWHRGLGAEVCSRRVVNDNGGGARYGLEVHRHGDGTLAAWRPIGDDLRPELLADGRDGTQVILLGRDAEHDTTKPPLERTIGRGGWVGYYLNTRFFELPPDVNVSVCNGSLASARTSVVRGQRSFLDEQAEEAGCVELGGARVRWWLLRHQPARGRQSPLWASSGHLAVLHRHELYGTLDSTEGGYATLQNSFGLRIGYERVVAYVEPDPARVDVDIKRTHVLVDGGAPPWDRWGREFQLRLPDPLRQLQDDAPRTVDARPTIRRRLEQHAGLFAVSPYRPRRPARTNRSDCAESRSSSPSCGRGGASDRVRLAGAVAIVDRSDSAAPAASRDGVRDQPQTARVSAASVARSLAHRRRASPPEIILPDVRWVSVDDGTRALGELEDLAARYDQRADLLTINGDFRLITDMIRRWRSAFTGAPGARQLVLLAVRESFEQTLIEAVLTARALEGTSDAWPRRDAEPGPDSSILTPHALTIAVFSRQLMDAAIKKRLAQRLGRPQHGG